MRPTESRRSGYEHWPELRHGPGDLVGQSRRSGYEHWPELVSSAAQELIESRRSGYEHWPERPGFGAGGQLQV